VTDRILLDGPWDTLLQEAKGRRGEGVLRRRLSGTGVAEVHLALDLERSAWALLIGVPADWAGDVTTFPRWRGVLLTLREEVTEDLDRKFIELKMGPGSNQEVFRALVADLVDLVSNPPPGTLPLDVFSNRLAVWKGFFEERGQEGLSQDAQAGLFGELWFLRQYLLPTLGAGAGVEAWTGCRRTNHDFQLPGGSFEIKTSVGKEHLRFHVASERQLDDTGLAALHVIFFAFAPLAASGETLPDLISSLRSAFSKVPQVSSRFAEKLIEAGYSEAHADRYRTGYAPRLARSFHVRTGFPRITESDLPQGVGDIGYSVMVSACEPFKTQIDAAVKAAASLP
jgi:hypothetical protein